MSRIRRVMFALFSATAVTWLRGSYTVKYEETGDILIDGWSALIFVVVVIVSLRLIVLALEEDK